MPLIRDRLLQKVFWFLLASALALGALSNSVIYPMFTRLVQVTTEDEAVRLGRHLSSLLVPGEATALTLTPEVETELLLTGRDFRAMKIKIFDSRGTVVFSTDREDVGTVNDNAYFHEFVARGEVYTKMVRKDTPSLEGHQVSIDVVETYVPVLRGRVFLGALEIYYDVSRENEMLHGVLFKSHLFSAVAVVMFLLFSMIFLFRLDRTITEREKSRRELQEEHAALGAANAVIKENRNKLQDAFAYMSGLIQEVIVTGNMHLRYENPHLVQCSTFLRCEMKECPCYNRGPVRCWQIAGTFCGGEVQGTHAQKYGNCKDCEVFKAAAVDPLAMIGEHFNNMMHLLATKHNTLQSAFDEIETLRGIIPICAYCKKIRNDEGYWGQVESYVEEHTEAKFSHGLCPECARKHFPNLFSDEEFAEMDKRRGNETKDGPGRT